MINRVKLIILLTLTLGLFFFSGPVSSQELIADHTSAAAFNSINTDHINYARSHFKLAYGHTSHGSQIITGMRVLGGVYDCPSYDYTCVTQSYECSEDAFICDRFPTYVDPGNSSTRVWDLGNPNYTAWATATRNLLDGVHYNRNMVMWSWCGQVSSSTEAIIAEDYLANMAQLENDFPNVTFIYMTGHLDGTYSGGNLHQRNEQIRQYARDHDKILFDFADIESYDPENAGYLDLGAGVAANGCSYINDNGESDNWCSDWCGQNGGDNLCDDGGSCAHSNDLNCNLKARAFWWLMAKLAEREIGGGDTTPPSRYNGSPQGTEFDAGTTQVNLTLDTNEWANCRYSESEGTAYNSMGGTFAATDASHTSHIASVNSSNGQSYDYYVRCEDAEGNQNTNDYHLYFSVAAPDTTPPQITSGSPQGTQFAADIGNVTLQISTNEWANCRYTDVSDSVAFADMTNNFDSNASHLAHQDTVSAENGESYDYWVRCEDSSGNADSSSFHLYFSVTMPDTTAPEQIDDLAVSCESSTSCVLTWRAPGDDGDSGTANAYDLRFSLSSIDESNWQYATQASGEPSPNSAGALEQMTVNALSPSTLYYFAIKASDEADNISALSNVVNDTTSDAPDTVAPIISNPSPTGELSSLTTSTAISVNTNENADCAYSENDVSYASMTDVFSTTGGTYHSSLIENLVSGENYRFFVRCEDSSGNVNQEATLLEFSIAADSSGDKPIIDPEINWQTDGDGDLSTVMVTGCGSAQPNKEKESISFALLLLLVPVVYTLRKKETVE